MARYHFIFQYWNLQSQPTMHQVWGTILDGYQNIFILFTHKPSGKAWALLFSMISSVPLALTTNDQITQDKC